MIYLSAFSILKPILFYTGACLSLLLAVYILAKAIRTLPFGTMITISSLRKHYSTCENSRDAFFMHTMAESLIFSTLWSMRTREDAWFAMVEFLKCKSVTSHCGIAGHSCRLRSKNTAKLKLIMRFLNSRYGKKYRTNFVFKIINTMTAKIFTILSKDSVKFSAQRIPSGVRRFIKCGKLE